MYMSKPRSKNKFVRYSNGLALSKLCELEKEGCYNSLVLAFVRKSLKRDIAPREWFSSELQYMMYRRYFRGYVTNVLISPNYAVIGLNEFNVRKIRYWDSYRIVNISRTWLVGINSDGKLFINLIRYDGITNTKNKEPSITIEPSIGYVSDDYVRSTYLLYNKDSNDSEIVYINEEPNPVTSIRIQGEILLTLEGGTVEQVIRRMVNDIAFTSLDNIYAIAHTYYSNIIRRVLVNLGFSNINIRRNIARTRIEIPNVVPNYRVHNEKKEKILDRKLSKLKEIICRSLNECNENDILNVYVPYGRVNWNGYRSIMVEVELQNTKVTRTIADYITKESEKLLARLVNEKIRKKYTVYMGNHKIVIESLPLEYNFILPNDINPIKEIYPENGISIGVSIRNNVRFYVLPGYEVTLYHNEHGIVKAIFSRPYIVTLTTTLVTDIHNVYMNRIAFSRL